MDQSKPEFHRDFLKEISEMEALDSMLALYHQYQDQWQRFSEEEGASFCEKFPEFIVETRALFLVLAERHNLSNIKPPQLRNFAPNELAKFDTFMHELLGLLEDSRLKILSDSFERSFRRMLAAAEMGSPLQESMENTDMLEELKELRAKMEYRTNIV